MSNHAHSPLPAMAAQGDLATRVRAVLDDQQRRGRTGRLCIAAATIAVAAFAGLVSPLQLVSASQSAAVTQGTLEFEVASIRPTESGPVPSNGFQTDIDHGWLRARNVTLLQLIEMAFQTQSHRIVNVPSWLSTERFDVNARGKADATERQVFGMLQILLAERFKLRHHSEAREFPVYALETLRTGHKLVANEKAKCEAEAVPPNSNLVAKCGDFIVLGTAQRGAIFGRSLSLAVIADALAFYLDRPVVEKTGISGVFDFAITWKNPGEKTPAPPPEEELNRPQSDGFDEVTIFTAVQERAGLRLASTRGLVEAFVIDSVEPPTGN